MRKTLIALGAAAVIGTGTIANPTPSHAMAPAVVAAIVVVAVVGTVVVAQAVTRPAYANTGTITVKPRKHKKMK